MFGLIFPAAAISASLPALSPFSCLALPRRYSGSVSGMEPDRLGEVRDGAVVVFFGAVDAAAVVEGDSVFGIEPDRLVEVRDGVVVVHLGSVGAAAVVEGMGGIRIEADRFCVVRDRAVLIILVAVGTAA